MICCFCITRLFTSCERKKENEALTVAISIDNETFLFCPDRKEINIVYQKASAKFTNCQQSGLQDVILHL